MKTKYHVKYVDFGTVELDIPEGMSRTEQEDLVIQAEQEGMVNWHSREVAEVTPQNGWSEEPEGKLDTIYSADIHVEDDCHHFLGSHLYDINGTVEGIVDDSAGLCCIKDRSAHSLKQWFIALHPSTGLYYYDATFTRNDSYGENWLAHEEGSILWNNSSKELKFI